MSTSATFFLPSSFSGTSPGSGRAALTKPRRWIDAATRDYVVEGGDFKQDDGFTSKVVLALATRRGSCLVAPWFGSRLHEIRYADERGRGLAETFTKQALAHLTAQIKDLRVKATIVHKAAILIVVSGRRGRSAVRIEYTAKVAA